MEISKKYTLGTRLTGAGWGGCTVSLLYPENVDKYLEFLKENYYKDLGVVDRFESVLFATSPKGGACIYVWKCWKTLFKLSFGWKWKTYKFCIFNFIQMFWSFLLFLLHYFILGKPFIFIVVCWYLFQVRYSVEFFFFLWTPVYCNFHLGLSMI